MTMIKIKSMTANMLSSILMSATLLKKSTKNINLEMQLEEFIETYNDISDKLDTLPDEILYSLTFDYSFPVRHVTLMSTSLMYMVSFCSIYDSEIAREMTEIYESIYDHIDRCIREEG